MIDCYLGKFLTLFMFILITPSCAYSNEYWRIDSRYSECVLENIGSYSEVESSLVTIVVPACPETDVEKGLRTLTENSAIPGVQGTLGEFDNVIFFFKDEIMCMKETHFRKLDIETLIPKSINCNK